MSKSSQPTLGEIQELVRVFSRQGQPEKGAKLKVLFEAGDPIPYELLDPAGKVRSETPVEGKLKMPARSGRGSGQPKWMDFAMKVSDFDEAILTKLTRDEIIELLEDREIIESEGEPEGESGGSQEEDSEGEEDSKGEEDSEGSEGETVEEVPKETPEESESDDGSEGSEE